jgi:hypothetical protein
MARIDMVYRKSDNQYGELRIGSQNMVYFEKSFPRVNGKDIELRVSGDDVYEGHAYAGKRKDIILMLRDRGFLK